MESITETLSTIAVTNTDVEIITLVENFLAKSPKKLPPLHGICALTLGVDNSSLVGTFIFDYSEKKILKHYPGRYPCNSPIYTEINDVRWTINLATDLTPKSSNGKLGQTLEEPDSFPFCCDKNTLMYKRRLSNDHVFNSFMKKNGSADYTFRVVKKIQYGDLLWIKHFTLNNGKIKEIDRPESEYKVNSFKIYSCNKHNTYYSVDLHTSKDQYNYHHAKGQNETEYGPTLLQKMQTN
jgi:hypothetical protein